MTCIPYLMVYASLAAAVVTMLLRFAMWARMPMHLRWELYPVAHEGSRAHYGGSYLEESRWWEKPREVSLLGEARVMIPEILFLHCLWENNRPLWLRSFPFHFGLYLLIGGTALLAADGVLGALWPDWSQEAAGAFLRVTVQVALYAGLGLGTLGALGLLQRRLADPRLRVLSSGADILNLLLFALALGVGLITALLLDRDLSLASAFWGNLLTLGLDSFPYAGPEAALPLISLALLCGLAVYVPTTHMSHFIGKYFAYHDIRWNDAPNLPGGEDEAVVARLLQRPVSWAAPHIQGQGRMSWAELANEEMKR